MKIAGSQQAFVSVFFFTNQKLSQIMRTEFYILRTFPWRMLIVFLSTLQIISMPVASEYLCQPVADHHESISLDW